MGFPSRGVSTAAFLCLWGYSVIEEEQTVTAIQEQRRNRNRANIHLDGQYAFSLAAIVAARLQIGQRLSEGQIAALQEQDSLEKAKESAYRLLSYRPRSTAEIRQRLAQKGFEKAIIEKVITRLSELELLDDRAFAQYWIEQRNTFRPRSRLALRQELYQKGLDRDLIEEAVSEVNEFAAARKIGEKNIYRWKQQPHDDFLADAYRYLRRQGFDHGTARRVSEDLWRSLANDQA